VGKTVGGGAEKTTSKMGEKGASPDGKKVNFSVHANNGGPVTCRPRGKIQKWA